MNLGDELDLLFIELKSDRPLKRNKAFGRILHLLATQLQDVQNIIENSNSTTWNDFFSAAHQGLIYQADKMFKADQIVDEYHRDIKVYSETIIKITQSASTESKSVSFLQITQNAIEVFSNEGLIKYFGKTYLILLQKTVLNPKNNLTEISTLAWKQLLKRTLSLMKSPRHNLKFNDLSSCAYDVVEIGCFYSHLPSELLGLKVFTYLQTLLEKRADENEKFEVIAIAYQCCKNMLGEQREEICKFVQTVSEYLVAFLRKNDLSDKLKILRIKLMDLILIAHIPNLGKVDQASMEFIPDRQSWMKIMTECEGVIRNELAQSLSKYRDKKSADVNPIVVQCAARYCFYLHWNDQRKLEEEGEPSSSKRARVATKVEFMMEKIRPSLSGSDFSWKWLIVFSELIFNYNDCLMPEDIPQILKMLSECQSLIDYTQDRNSQIYAFTKCCYVIIQKEKIITNPLVATLCREIWMKIGDETVRVSAGSTNGANEAHVLLQLLIRYEKCSSPSFIESVLKMFTSNTVNRNEKTLKTLISLLKTFNLDSLANGKDLAQKILNYALQKHTMATLKKVITSGNEKPSNKLLSELSICCCLLKTDVINFVKKYQKFDDEKIFEENWDLKNQMDYIQEIEKTTKLIRKKNLNVLILEDDDYLELKDQSIINEAIPTELKCIVDLSLFEVLMQLTEPRTRSIDANNSVEEIRDYIRDVLESNDLMMHLASSLLRYHALNEEKLNSSFIAKKIVFHIQEIERLFSLIIRKAGQFDLSDTYTILTSLKAMFSAQYHSVIVMRIRAGNLKFCINWIAKQIEYESNEDVEREQPISEDAFKNAKSYEKIRYLAITTLSQYFYYEGTNTNDVVNCLIQHDFYIEDNMDLHTILEVIDLFAQQSELPGDAANWIWIGIINICKFHKNRLYLMKEICDRLDKIVKISQQFSEQTSSVNVLFKAFSALCSDDDQKLNREVCIKFLEKFPFYHKSYFKLCYDESIVQFMYLVVSSKFLKNKSFEIQAAAIKCFSAIMKFDIDAEINVDDMEIIINCRNDIFKHFREHIMGSSEELEVEEPAFRIQLYTSLFCASFHLRKPMIFEISRLFYSHKYSDEISIKCFEKILKFLNCEARSLMDNSSLLFLISKWVMNSYQIINFPWYFTGSPSYPAFVETFYDTILLALMKNNCQLVDNFVENSSNDDFNIKDAFDLVISDCFAFTIPIKANCQGIKYEVKAKELQAKMDEIINKENRLKKLIEHLPEVIQKLLVNVIDIEKFQQISGLQFDFYAQDESISLENFEMCMEYLQRKCGTSDQSLMTFLCCERKRNVEKLFMLQRSRIQSTELKEHKILYLLQYCILVEQTYEYMKDRNVRRNVSIKDFLMREFVSYFCFLICTTTYGTKLRETAANFFHDCLKEIIPSCIEEFKPLMSKIMPNLVTIAQGNDTVIKSKCLEIIQFLVMQPALSDEVAKIDRFPVEFDELRTYQKDIKYALKELSLSDEIEHFLSVKNRKVEGIKELSGHLADKKSELKSVFERVEIEGNNSLICKLLRSLIEYIQFPADDERAVEAIKCLGEIGSHNLSKIVFNADDPDIYQTIESVSHCQKLICSKILDKMETLLLHSNPKIFEASSAACHHIFLTVSSQGYPDSPYLRPFQCEKKAEVHLFYLVPKVDKIFDLDMKKLFEDNKTTPYANWIVYLCVMLMRFAGDKVLSSIPDFPLSLAEALNSQIFQLLVQYDREEVNVELLNGINFFFSQCNEALNYKEKTNEGSIFIDKKAIREMLKLAEVIRMSVLNNSRSNMAQISNLNYLYIAKAAKHCEAYFTAIMYCEMWAQRELENDSEKTFKISIENKTLQDVMYNSYSAIGISDTFDIYLNPFTHRSAYLQNTKQYFQMLFESENTENLSQICYDTGLYHLVNKFSDLMKDQDKSRQYDCLWRLCQWDVVVETEQELKDENGLVDLRGEFDKYHYLGLQCLKNGDEVGTNCAVDKGRKLILQLMSQQSLECTKTLYKFLEMSHRLVQIEDFGEIRFKRIQNAHEKLLKKWSTHDELPFDYEQYERVLMQRNSIFDTANIKAGRRTWIPAANKTNLLFAIKQSIIACRPNNAYNIISKMKRETMELSDQMELLIEESKLNIKTDVNLAKKCLLMIIEEKKIEKDFITKSIAHRLYGEILADNYASNISDISEKHFEKAQKYLLKYAMHHQKSHLVPSLDDNEQLTQFSQTLVEEQSDDVDRKIKSSTCIFDTIAKYFDREYVSKCAYMKSLEYQKKKSIFDRNLKLLDAMNQDGKIRAADVEVKKSYTTLSRSLQLDKEEFKTTETEKKNAARNALYNYVRSTIQSADNDILNIFRIISLMLENYESSKFFQNFLTDNISKIQSYKFIVALPQLTVRLTNSDKDILTVLLKKLLEKCAIDHPHHTLPLILALKNSNADAEKKTTAEPRVLGAEQLWSKIKRNRTMAPIMEQLESMASALIDLAYIPLKDKEPNFIPASHKLLKLKNMKFLQCPTVELPIRKNGNYQIESLITVIKWDQRCSGVGGINAPKKIEVLCSDGILRSQLLKGRDDMRQDAIMQQIFVVVNQLLNLNNDMKMKQAKIRTYRVVPLSCRSGILEWCSDTMPIGMYLVGSRERLGAHQKYRPNDWLPSHAQKIIMDNDTKSSEVKIATFHDICSHLKPVFHQFFYENFKSPGMIFERRFAYTVSVAVSSMIGYILGIGDRHVHNILIDMKTAEVIHIDFGIAFEAGKCLPHPELIPFRLTRDILAPMGVSGVNGTFRKTCEKTIEILREHEKTIITILEVLLYDPMYVWSIGAKHARARQLNDSEERESLGTEENHDSMATRALQRVQAKLKGFADDTSTCYPSIDGQIQYLIQAATDVGNLSKLFRGWQAYL